MSELSPTAHSSDLEITELFAFQAMLGHWREYYAQPEDKRLGDESVWHTVLVEAAQDIGFDKVSARELCEVAQFQAQLMPDNIE